MLAVNGLAESGAVGWEGGTPFLGWGSALNQSLVERVRVWMLCRVFTALLQVRSL